MIKYKPAEDFSSTRGIEAKSKSRSGLQATFIRKDCQLFCKDTLIVLFGGELCRSPNHRVKKNQFISTRSQCVEPHWFLLITVPWRPGAVLLPHLWFYFLSLSYVFLFLRASVKAPGFRGVQGGLTFDQIGLYSYSRAQRHKPTQLLPSDTDDGVVSLINLPLPDQSTTTAMLPQRMTR